MSSQGFFGGFLSTDPMWRQEFFTTGTTGGLLNPFQNLHIWRKPKGARFVSMFLIGSGGGGGGGHQKASGTNGGGGGGGGSSACTGFLFMASMLPAELGVLVPRGGLGGGASAGGAGGLAWVGRIPITPGTLGATETVAFSGGAAAGGGGTGTLTATGPAGSFGTVTTVTSAAMSYSAIGFSSIAGQPGVSGGAVAGGVGSSITAVGVTMGGSGGGGCNTTDFAGGTITVSTDGYFPTLPGGVAAGGRGTDGPTLRNPTLYYGGTGGGSNASGTGGNGGDGAIGCGGGGGGAGTVRGTGGKGGDGYVIIECW